MRNRTQLRRRMAKIDKYAKYEIEPADEYTYREWHYNTLNDGMIVWTIGQDQQLTNQECKAIIAEAAEIIGRPDLKNVKVHTKGIPIGPSIHRGRVIKETCYADPYRDDPVINLTPWGKQVIIVLHEFVHCVTVGNGHGSHYRRVFFQLLEAFGYGDAALFEQQCQEIRKDYA